jgi:Tol biopolymer transport system component
MVGLVVGVSPARGQAPKQAAGPSHVTVMNVGDLSKKVIFTVPRNIQAPNWSPDGSYLLLNGGGRLWKMPSEGGEPEVVDTGPIKGLNNDHGISPDGKTLAISAGQIFLVPAAGGRPRQVTSQTPSYYHGWSPDGRTLAYCAKRGENFDLYAIATEGGEERRLTSHDGYDDGPDYSPDGRWIYFNSDRSGSWDIWRIPASGAGPDDALAERVTSDEFEDWFPHASPDGKWMVFISFKKGTKGHPAGQDVVLRMMPMPGDRLAPAEIREIDQFYGGQGTINVNSWSPDGRRFAYVTYDAPTVSTP